jgi:integrase
MTLESICRKAPLESLLPAGCPSRVAQAAAAKSPDELVFATVHGTPLHESNVNRRVWRPALERAGLADESYRWHDLRHTCVSRLVAAGADVKFVQAVAEHASPLITLKRYSHRLDSRLTEAADRFDRGRSKVAKTGRFEKD